MSGAGSGTVKFLYGTQPRRQDEPEFTHERLPAPNSPSVEPRSEPDPEALDVLLQAQDTVVETIDVRAVSSIYGAQVW